jgi:hypothetical protein
MDDFASNRIAGIRAGLRLTPAERLRWLEETMDRMHRWVGRARAKASESEGGSGPKAGERRERG